MGIIKLYWIFLDFGGKGISFFTFFVKFVEFWGILWNFVEFCGCDLTV